MIKIKNRICKLLLAGLLTIPVGLTGLASGGVNLVLEDSTQISLSSENPGNYISSKESLADSIIAGLMAGERGQNLSMIGSDETSQSFDGTIVGGPNTINQGQAPGAEARIYGENRFETAVKVAKDLGVDRHVLIINGYKLSDSMVAIPFAAKYNYNILYTGEDFIPKETRDYLKTVKSYKKVHFIGGEHSLTREVKEEVLDLIGKDANVDELTIAGSNRFETSQVIANKFTDYNSYVVVEGSDELKAIQASVKAAHKHSPLVLVRDEDSMEAKLENLDSSVAEIIYLAGVDQADLDYIHGNSLYNLIDSQGQLIQAQASEEKATEPGVDTESKTIILEDGSVRRYSRVIEMNTTAYNIFPGSTGYTASGTKARHGAVSVDPSVIPLGTNLYITSTDDWPDYGLATAEDTGGAIKGNKLDLFYDSYDTCVSFGRRATIVYVLED